MVEGIVGGIAGSMLEYKNQKKWSDWKLFIYTLFSFALISVLSINFFLPANEGLKMDLILAISFGIFSALIMISCYYAKKRKIRDVYMSKFKHASLALVAAGLLSAQARAGEAQVQSLQAMPVATFSHTDINTMFEQAGKPMQLVALSGQEMKDTEGAWGFASFFGAGVGMYTYGLSCSSCSVRGFAAAGAFGAFAPVSSVTRFYGSMGLATGYGVGSRRGWW